MALENSSNKVKEISEILYKETILPAKEESQKIIDDAKEHAASIIHNANEEAKKLLDKNTKEIAEERKVHESSIELAIKQAIAVLKSQVLDIFNKELSSNMKDTLNQQEVCQNLLQVLIDGIKKEGISSDLRLFVSKKVNFDQLVTSLTSSVLGKIEKSDIEISSGIALMIKEKKLTLKITEQTISELLSGGLSEMLRNKVFA